MATVMTMRVPFDSDVYDRVNEEMDTENNLPQGLVHHYAAKDGDEMIIFDVWDSQEDFERFNTERLMPAIGKVLGGPPPAGGPEPTLAELHEHFPK